MNLTKQKVTYNIIRSSSSIFEQSIGVIGGRFYSSNSSNSSSFSSLRTPLHSQVAEYSQLHAPTPSNILSIVRDGADDMSSSSIPSSSLLSSIALGRAFVEALMAPVAQPQPVKIRRRSLNLTREQIVLGIKPSTHIN